MVILKCERDPWRFLRSSLSKTRKFFQGHKIDFRFMFYLEREICTKRLNENLRTNCLNGSSAFMTCSSLRAMMVYVRFYTDPSRTKYGLKWQWQLQLHVYPVWQLKTKHALPKLIRCLFLSHDESKKKKKTTKELFFTNFLCTCSNLKTTG